MDLLRDLNRRLGMTRVLVTHDAGVGARCDRIVRMRDGTIVGEEHPQLERIRTDVPLLITV